VNKKDGVMEEAEACGVLEEAENVAEWKFQSTDS
jgi:hypothetical protein